MGKGKTLVVVHGGPGLNHSYFMPHFEQLAKDFRIVFYDQRASGKSSTPSPDSISLSFFANDIEAIRKHLGLEKIYLLAHSWGAIPAMEYAKNYRQQTGGIIFCNAVPLNKQFDREMRENQLKKMSGLDSTDRSIIMGSPNFKAGKASAYRKLLLLTFRNSFARESNYELLNLEIPANYKTASAALYTGLGKELGSYDYYEDLKLLPFPVLVLHGSEDAIPLKADQMIQERASRATLHEFRKSGHFIFIEENKKFSNEVGRFLKDY